MIKKTAYSFLKPEYKTYLNQCGINKSNFDMLDLKSLLSHDLDYQGFKDILKTEYGLIPEIKNFSDTQLKAIETEQDNKYKYDLRHFEEQQKEEIHYILNGMIPQIEFKTKVKVKAKTEKETENKSPKISFKIKVVGGLIGIMGLSLFFYNTTFFLLLVGGIVLINFIKNNPEVVINDRKYN